MSFLAKENDFVLEEDIKFVSSTSPGEFNQYLLENNNKTTFGVLFCVDEWVDDITSNTTTLVLPCKPDPKFPLESGIDFKMYTLQYNFTLAPNSFL